MRRLLLVTALFASFAQAADPIAIEVHRDANCGCCKAWIEHLEANGFEVDDHVETDMAAVKTRLGVPHSLSLKFNLCFNSCLFHLDRET